MRGRFNVFTNVSIGIEIDGVYNAVVGGENPFGFIYARVLDNNGIDFGQAIGELDG
ncbi:hypothetical protein MT356_01670 [Rathayibacter festucae]|uniref:hypothetical protein n=1 Tax=Rathayibacter festucae TaxID=110937 RepID=UPI001FB1E562|nr:hypothetical protein [Rathayibacter festucae]MCJ1698411.1 hypothetical protein [Rathayibacter festucae]